MGKKRRMIAHPQKFEAKYANHPAIATTTTPVAEEVVETPVIKEVVEVPIATTTTKTATKKKKSTWSRKKAD